MKRVFCIPNDSKKDYGKFIGFNVDEFSNSKLTLLSIAKKLSKSMLLRESLFQYCTEFKESLLIDEIAQKAYHIWMVDYKDLNVGKKPLVVFKQNLENDLRYRGLFDDLINKIIINFEKIKQANGS